MRKRRGPTNKTSFLSYGRPTWRANSFKGLLNKLFCSLKGEEFLEKRDI